MKILIQRINIAVFSSISSFLGSIPAFVWKHRKVNMALLVGFTLFCVAGIPRLKIDHSLESFFHGEDNTLKEYMLFRYLFGSDEFIVAMLPAPNGNPYSENTLKRLKTLENHLNEARLDKNSVLSHIKRVRSLVSADTLKSTEHSLVSGPLVGEDFPKSKNDELALQNAMGRSKLFKGAYVSPDETHVAVMITTDFGARLKKVSAPKELEEENSDASEAVFEFDSAPPSKSLLDTELPPLERTDMLVYSRFLTELRSVFEKSNWIESKTGILKPDANDDTEVTHFLMTGNPWIMDFFTQLLKREMGLFMTSSLLLIMLVLFLAFRAGTAVLGPTCVVILSIIWTIGLIGWSSTPMSMMINIIIFLIIAAGIASSVHVMSGFQYYRRTGLGNEEAVSTTLLKSGLPIFLANVTTIVGLLSLVFVPIQPLRNFSLFSSLGIFFTFFGAVYVLPLLMHYRPPNFAAKKKNAAPSRLISMLERFLMFSGEISEKRPVLICSIFFTATAISVVGIPKIFIDTNLTEVVKPGNGMKEAYRTVDQHFGGTASVEILIDSAKADGMKNPRLLKAIDRFSKKVLENRGDFVKRIYSVVDIAKTSAQFLGNGQFEIPTDDTALAQILVSFNSADPSTRKLFVDDDWQVGRVSLQVVSKGSYEYDELMQQLEAWLGESLAEVKEESPNLTHSITGGIPLLMELTRYVSISQVRSFGIALFVISCILFFLYGSIRMGVVAILPNLIPVAVVTGVIGWAGIPLDSDTLLVVPIAIGIAVDDTIHFLTHYKANIIAGLSIRDSIHATLKEVGQAMFFTSAVLSVGYLIFILSAYQPLTNFGILSAIAICSALLADLFLLPALISLVKPLSQFREEWLIRDNNPDRSEAQKWNLDSHKKSLPGRPSANS